MGGEPALNPKLTELLITARDHFPATKYLLVVTNGFLLHRHEELPAAIKATRAMLHVSVHHQSMEYQHRLKPVRELVSQWQSEFGIEVMWRESSSHWVQVYHGSGSAMRPFDDRDPAASWQACQSKWCMQLHEGRLWKCPALAYLPMQAQKYGLFEIPEWTPYHGYSPLEPSCSDAELDEFVNRAVEPQCAMCPAKPKSFELPNPLHRAARKGPGGGG